MEEQGCTPEEEYDGHDKEADQFLLLYGGKPVGTMRIFTNTETNSYRFGRVAILKEYRGKGLGYSMLDLAIHSLKPLGDEYKIVLDAQVYAIGFYEKLGFRKTSDDVFMDARIPHVHMELVRHR